MSIGWAAGPSPAQLNAQTHFSFQISTPLPLSRICPPLSQPSLGFGQVYVMLGLWKPQRKPKWIGEGLPLPPPATASVYEIRGNQETGTDCLGKYICNILTIFIHSFYWDMYYRHLRIIPSAQTRHAHPSLRPFLPPLGPG